MFSGKRHTYSTGDQPTLAAYLRSVTNAGPRRQNWTVSLLATGGVVAKWRGGWVGGWVGGSVAGWVGGLVGGWVAAGG